MITRAALIIMPLDPSPTQPGWDAPAAQAAQGAPSARLGANAFGTPIPVAGKDPNKLLAETLAFIVANVTEPAG